MKQILENQYFKSIHFGSQAELSVYIKKTGLQNSLFLEDSFGEYYYCYVCLDSLTNEKKFSISFSTDTDQENLNFLFWEKHGLYILDTGVKIYFISNSLVIKSSFDINSPLIGLYVYDQDKVLVLEEATFRLINSNGEILKEELFDLALDFRLENNKLSISTDNKTQIYLLD